MSVRYVKDRIKREMPNLDFSEIRDKVRYFAEHNLFGIDINDRMARVAKMNMIMHGDGHCGIFNCNGLYLTSDVSQHARNEIKDGSFQIALSNPPFAGYEKDPDILRKFELGMRKGKPRGVTKEVLFLERIINLLDYGGKAAIVLPQGIYSDKILKFARDHIKKRCKILALVALPIWAFRPSGTGVRGSLIFIEKVEEVPEDYNIFIKKVQYIGFNSRGKQDKNELEDVVTQYRTKSNRNDWITFKQLNSCFGYSKTGRIDPRFFLKESRYLLNMFRTSPFPLMRLEEVADFSDEVYNPKKEPDREFVYIEVNDIDVKTGKIRKRFRQGKSITQGTLTIHEGQILMSRRWPDRGAIALVPKEFEGALLVKEVSALIVKEGINILYLYDLFRTRQFLDLMDVYTTGEMSHRISEEDLKNIKIPVPDQEMQDAIVNSIGRKKRDAIELRKKAEQMEQESQQLLFDKLNLKSIPEKYTKESITYKRI